jgi:hypothetical protein
VLACPWRLDLLPTWRRLDVLPARCLDLLPARSLDFLAAWRLDLLLARCLDLLPARRLDLLAAWRLDLLAAWSLNFLLPLTGKRAGLGLACLRGLQRLTRLRQLGRTRILCDSRRNGPEERC